MVTQDLLVGCELAGSTLLCGCEGSTQPRRLVFIDGETGRERVLFDPNPEFASIRLGPAQRLHWRNAAGEESYGDLVLPPDRAGTGKLPLIVVQYISRGFLRGGVGDEFPIQLFVQDGYAVFSFQNHRHTWPVGPAAGDQRRRCWQRSIAAGPTGAISIRL